MAYEELKQRQSAMWGNGPYQRISDTLEDIHDLVIERLARPRATAGSISRAARAPSPSVRPRRGHPWPASTCRRC